MYLYRQSGQPDSELAAWHGFSEPQPQPQQQQRAKQIYAAQSRVRELTDRGFQNIFYDRGKLIVVSFWADSCRPCDAVASTVVSVAQQIASGPHAKVVKFYHAQWDPAVNPRLHTQYGFKKIPVVFFYYMCSGKQPSKEVSLLEAATRGDRFDTDAASYLRNIETILRRHGHIVPTKTVAQTKGWSHSHALVDRGDFKHVDQMLIEPSRARQYFDDRYCTNPGLRLSRLARIVDRNQFNLIYQRIHGHLPDANTMGVVNPRTNEVSLVTINQHMQIHLNSAVHEAVHLLTCRAHGRFAFFDRYGFGMNEGFTQLLTEGVLSAQRVSMASRPYDIERQMAEKLVQKMGFTTVADDYFRCTQNVATRLGARSMYLPFMSLSAAATRARSEDERKEKYRDIIRLLDSLP
jgi:thiol-disulfide isomerase/thioredoxin